jgi:hypothetical protein
VGVGAQHGGAGRLEADDRHAGSGVGGELATVRAEDRRAASSWPVVIQVRPQHTVVGR